LAYLGTEGDEEGRDVRSRSAAQRSVPKLSTGAVALDVDVEIYDTPVSPGDFRAAATRMPDELDRERTTQQRTKSRYIRNHLFPSPTATCDLCGEVFPCAFLVGAHIKKRAACSHAEKIDIPNVVMAACVFGCDALFEKSYVTVADNWSVRVSGPTGSAALDKRLAQLAGRSFPHRDALRLPYFLWHRNNTFRG